MEAPLSSPSLNGPSKNQSSYFASSNSSSAQSSGPTSAPQTTQPQQQPPQPPPQRQMPTDSASPFLRDFNLVAEAAKRAQMAVVGVVRGFRITNMLLGNGDSSRKIKAGYDNEDYER
ncbi:hypothetical protein F5882DRAFT_512578 [Hyaloscypha sp. PMI_1271]|nr:hypothetical protein F5882DRAFT_512578 [Hyaloscypha sp. PMI_1271]